MSYMHITQTFSILTISILGGTPAIRDSVWWWCRWWWYSVAYVENFCKIFRKRAHNCFACDMYTIHILFFFFTFFATYSVLVNYGFVICHVLWQNYMAITLMIWHVFLFLNITDIYTLTHMHIDEIIYTWQTNNTVHTQKHTNLKKKRRKKK